MIPIQMKFPVHPEQAHQHIATVLAHFRSYPVQPLLTHAHLVLNLKVVFMLILVHTITYQLGRLVHRQKQPIRIFRPHHPLQHVQRASQWVRLMVCLLAPLLVVTQVQAQAQALAPALAPALARARALAQAPAPVPALAQALAQPQAQAAVVTQVQAQAPAREPVMRLKTKKKTDHLFPVTALVLLSVDRVKEMQFNVPLPANSTKLPVC